MDQQRLYELADKWKKGVISDEDMAELTSLYRANAGWDDEVVIPEEFATDEAAHKARIWAAVKDKTLADKQMDAAEPAVVKPLRSNRWWWTAAAAVILLVGTTTAILVLNKSSHSSVAEVPRQTHSGSDIVPGSEKAILTLADGSTITLDNAAIGDLAQQGNTRIVKLSNGQIAYNLKGAGQGEVLMNTMRTPKGGKYQIVLPDGTKVWLNAGSSITYPAAFADAKRNVKVSGEVYFEVAPVRLRSGQKQPFIVDVDGKAQVEVLGTHFNVNSYSNEDAIRTTLLEGKVKVSTKYEVRNTNTQTSDFRLQTSVILSPGQQAELTTNDKLQTTNQIDIDQIMAWKNGYFNFDGANIQTVMRQIERWYDVEVVYENVIPKDKLMGELPMDAGIDRVLNILEGIGVHFRVEGKKITVTK